MNKVRSKLLVLAACAAPALGQDARSTLARLTDEAAVVARVKVLACTEAHGTRSLVLEVRETWKGERAGRVELRETAFQGCGQGLPRLLAGSGHIVFLDRAGELAVASSRAIVPAEPGLLEHVRALVGTTGPQRVAVLCAGLASPSDRVRRDAGESLCRSVHLDHAAAADRRRVAEALAARLADDQVAAFPLLRAAQRMRLREAVDVLLPRYLAGAGALEQPLLEAIPELDAGRAADALAADLPEAPRVQVRAVALLRRCDDAVAVRCLERLARSPSRAVARVAEQALAGHGEPPRFRSILRHEVR